MLANRVRGLCGGEFRQLNFAYCVYSDLVLFALMKFATTYMTGVVKIEISLFFFHKEKDSPVALELQNN